jgi:hypothetical protein
MQDPDHPDQPDQTGKPDGQEPASGRPEGGSDAGDAGDAGPEADLGPVLRGWDFEPGRTNVRLIRTGDGSRAIQVRLELGILQLAFDGRPDGLRPHGAESLLDWVQVRLEAHVARHGSTEGFRISPRDCDALRDEGVQYYHRYVALFALEEYEGVVRDTRRNLRLFDLCREFGTSQADRTVLEQYRPFVTMMRARAEAALALRIQSAPAALAAVDRALAELREHFEQGGSANGFDQSNEVMLLRGMRDALVPRLPVSQRSELEDRLKRAIEAENNELAAILRDELRQME